MQLCCWEGSLTCQADQLQGYVEHASSRISLASAFLSLQTADFRICALPEEMHATDAADPEACR